MQFTSAFNSILFEVISQLGSMFSYPAKALINFSPTGFSSRVLYTVHHIIPIFTIHLVFRQIGLSLAATRNKKKNVELNCVHYRKLM